MRKDFNKGVNVQKPTEKNYQVLARKYRPREFTDLIGQEVLVKTLTNAIDQGRLAHAFVFTGVRGVGKTTTARILARILQCKGPDGQKKMDIFPCGECQNCQAINDDKHVDVFEMDAASRTGVDDVREIIEGVRYRPVMGTYKIYIIDEVHMLSKQAFNALLKTLEEPPEHVKFIFATTEIRRVPITILSRCQRFDLRRVRHQELADHFKQITEQEGYKIEEEALNLIARAADGSVRDGLSLLDQAIAQGDFEGKSEKCIVSADVQKMLGVVDRTQTFELLKTLFAGQVAQSLALFEKLYAQSADPLIVLQDLAEYTHQILRLKIHLQNPSQGEVDFSLSDHLKEEIEDVAQKLSVPVLSRTWQMLLKGVKEIQSSVDPFTIVEMILIRIAYVADQPTLWDMANGQQASEGQAIETNIGQNAPVAGMAMGSSKQEPTASSEGTSQKEQPQTLMEGNLALEPLKQENKTSSDDVVSVSSFDDVIALCEQHKEAILLSQIREYMHLVKFKPGSIDVNLAEGAPQDLLGKLNQFLKEKTGKNWLISLSSEQGSPTLKQREKQENAEREMKVKAHPLMKKMLQDFPDAKIVSIEPTMKKESSDKEN